MSYGRHDGVELTGDLYAPKAPGTYPALVAVHGGAYQVGSAALYRFWGPYLAARGYVVLAVNYRLVTDGKKMYPEAVHDVRAAIQYLRSRGPAMNVDPERIGLIGDSAGGYFSALVALAGDAPPFAGAYKDDPYEGVSTAVKVCIGIYGVYDLTAQWHDDVVSRPLDAPSRLFLGTDLSDNRALYFEASPLSYVTRRNHPPAFLLAWGTEDDTVNPQIQSKPFLAALKQAGFFVRTVILQGAPHYFVSDPVDEPGSYTGFLAPRLLRFLQAQL